MDVIAIGLVASSLKHANWMKRFICVVTGHLCGHGVATVFALQKFKTPLQFVAVPNNSQRMTVNLPVTASPAMGITWTDAFTLGYGPIDAVHQEFVDLVAQLQTAPETDLPRCLDVFAAHAQAHFDLEDGWMRDTEFPARDCHIDEHAAVLRSVHEVREVLAQGDVANCRRLADELARWFPGHADYLDSALAAWMCKRHYGARPVVLRRRATTS